MERPIIMSSEMVRAILDGKKTMTRLPIEPSTSTVLGYNVTAKSKLWTGLVWDDRVSVDSGGDGNSPWQYLHVPWVHEDDPEDENQVVYRVRSRIEIGDWLFMTMTADSWAGQTPIERFWSRVIKTGACWEWMGSTKGKMHVGRMKIGQQEISVHRFSWKLHYGTIPETAMVLHHCDVPWCVNPSHLYLGDAQSNCNDKMERGRNHAASGEDAGPAKLFNYEAEDIRRQYEAGVNQSSLANAFGVNQSTISRILSDRYHHAPNPRPPLTGSRWLEVTGVRAERVQEISEADVYAEGVRPLTKETPYLPRYSFRLLWDKLNAARGYPWKNDDWVWPITFKVLSTTGRPE